MIESGSAGSVSLLEADGDERCGYWETLTRRMMCVVETVFGVHIRKEQVCRGNIPLIRCSRMRKIKMYGNLLTLVSNMNYD